MMKSKLWRSGSLILAPVLMATACTGNKVETEPVEIHFQVIYDKPTDSSQTIEKKYMAAADNFNQLNKDIKVVIDFLPPGTRIDQLMAGANPPDILPVNTSELQSYDEKGLLIDLQTFFDAEIDVEPMLLNTMMTNGKLYVLPFGATVSGVYYNKRMFDEAELPYPEGDWTWEQFRDYSLKIQEALQPAYGSLLDYIHFTLDTLLSSSGNRMLSPDGTTFVGYLDSPEGVRAMEWLNGYFRDDERRKSLDIPEDYNQFNNGQSAMYLGTSQDFFTGPVLNELGVAPLPHFEGTERKNPIFYFSFGISSKSKHPREAWEFIRYLTMSDNEDAIKLTDHYIPTSKLLIEAVKRKENPIRSVFLEELQYADLSMYDASPNLFGVWTSELNEQFNDLYAADNSELPNKLHELALKLDGGLN